MIPLSSALRTAATVLQRPYAVTMPCLAVPESTLFGVPILALLAKRVEQMTRELPTGSHALVRPQASLTRRRSLLHARVTCMDISKQNNRARPRSRLAMPLLE